MRQILLLEADDLEKLRRGERLTFEVHGESVELAADGARAPRTRKQDRAMRRHMQKMRDILARKRRAKTRDGAGR